MEQRLGYRVRPSIIWQRKRYDTMELILGIVNDGVAGMFRADREHRVILGAEVAAVRTGPPQTLAVAGHGGQDHVARQVVPPAHLEERQRVLQ